MQEPFGLHNNGIIGLLAGKTLAALNAPAFLPAGLDNFLFDTHWLWWISCGLVAAAVLWRGTTAGNRRLRIAGAVLLAITVVWILAAVFFTTPRKRLVAAHYAILHAAEKQQPTGILRYLSPHFHYGSMDRAAMRYQLGMFLRSIKIREDFVRKLSLTLHGATATSRFNVFSVTGNGSVLTRWTLFWRTNSAGHWLLTSARLRSVNNQPAPPNFGLPTH